MWIKSVKKSGVEVSKHQNHRPEQPHRKQRFGAYGNERKSTEFRRDELYCSVNASLIYTRPHDSTTPNMNLPFLSSAFLLIF